MTTGPAWDWELADRAGEPVERPTSPAFGNRFDAEGWLGEHWRQLADQGVATVRLRNLGQPAAAAIPLRTA